MAPWVAPARIEAAVKFLRGRLIMIVLFLQKVGFRRPVEPPLRAVHDHYFDTSRHHRRRAKFNDGDQSNQNEDGQHSGLRDREGWLALRRSQRMRAETFMKLCTTKTKTLRQS